MVKRLQLCWLLLVGGLLLSGLALPARAQAPADTDATNLRPEVVIPFMQTPPKIDGVINPGEWPTLHISRMVKREGTLQPRRAEFWLGSDGKKLYVAMQSAVHPTVGVMGCTQPEKYKQDAGRLFGGLFGFIGGEDYFDVIVDNNPGGQTGTSYRIAVNPYSAIYDTAYDHHMNVSNTSFRAVMQQAHTVKDGVWTAELAIELKSLGVTDLSKPLAIRIDRQFCSPGDYARWENPMYYTADFPGTYEMPETAPRVRFAAAAPIVNEAGVQNGQGIDLALDLSNPTAKPLALQVKLGYNPEKEARIYQTQQLTLQPGESKRVALQQPFAKSDDYAALGMAQVTGADGQLFYQRDFKWQTHEQPKWDDAKSTPPPPPVEFQIAFYPSYKILRWRTDFHHKDGAAQIKQARVVVVNAKTNAKIVEHIVAKLPGYATEQQDKLSDLAPGHYEARLFLDGATRTNTPVETQVFDYQTDFPWINNTLGISDEVIPPFTPLTVQGKTVGAILRQHTMADTGLWSQVNSLGKNILTGPIRFEVTQNGRLQSMQASMHFIKQKPNNVIAVANWSSGALHGRTTSDIDYDGCMKVTLDLSQQGKAKIDRLDMVIPLDDSQAPYMHEMADLIRVNYAGTVPTGEGTVWTSKEAGRGNLLGSFIPYIWVGGPERGICWFASNDRDWVVDPSGQNPALSLERHNGTLALRVRLIQRSATLTSTHTIVFGLQATPVKPMPENPDWRTWGVNSESKFNLIGLGSCIYWGCPYYSLVPLNGEYDVIRKIAESKKTGVRDDAYFKGVFTRIPDYKAEINLASQPGHVDGIIPYTNLLGADNRQREWVIYQDEWSHFTYNPDGRQTKFYDKLTPDGGWTDFCVLPVKSRQDYLLYCYKKILENGFDGIYWDNHYIVSNPSTVTGKAYWQGDDRSPAYDVNANAVKGMGYFRDQGQLQPDTNVWEMRELAKRTAILFYQMGKRNLILSHMTNGYFVPALSWATINFDWELHYGYSDFQDRFSRDYIMAETIGRQAGTRPIVLKGGFDDNDKHPWICRTRTAVVLPYELDIWEPDSQYQKIKAYFFAQGYGTDACKVYHSWDEQPVAKISRLDGEYLLLENKDRVILEISDFGNGGTAQIKLDVNKLGLAANFVATNWENSAEQATAENGVLTLPDFKKHDYRILVIQKAK